MNFGFTIIACIISVSAYAAPAPDGSQYTNFIEIGASDTQSLAVTDDVGVSGMQMPAVAVIDDFDAYTTATTTLDVGIYRHDTSDTTAQSPTVDLNQMLISDWEPKPAIGVGSPTASS